MIRPSSALLAVLLLAADGVAAPIGFNTALPVHEGGFLYRAQTVWTRAHDDPSPAGREMDVLAVPSVLVYGATPKLALMGVVPYVRKRLEVRSTGAVREASGLGDVTTLARYQVFERSAAGRTVRGAMFAGLKWPTGKDGLADSLGRLPRPVQPGSGSYDPFLGMVWTGQWLAFQLDADLSYHWNTEADGFEFGDVLAQNASVQYRLWPRSLSASGVPSFLYGVLEASHVYAGKNRAGGAPDPDSGGYRFSLTPGLQWVTKRIVLETAVQFPVAQALNGNALRRDLRLIGSVRVWL